MLGRSYTRFQYHSTQALSNLGVDVEEEVVQEEPQQLSHIQQIDDEMRNHLDLLANLTLDDNSDQCYPKIIDALQGVCIINASAGHRHSMFLDSFGGVYTCGSGYGPREKQEIPMKVMEFGKLPLCSQMAFYSFIIHLISSNFSTIMILGIVFIHKLCHFIFFFNHHDFLHCIHS